MKPQIRVELEDGTDTWVTYVPVNGTHAWAAISAAGDAFAMFIAGLARDEEAVERHLRNALSEAAVT